MIKEYTGIKLLLHKCRYAVAMEKAETLTELFQIRRDMYYYRDEIPIDTYYDKKFQEHKRRIKGIV